MLLYNRSTLKSITSANFDEHVDLDFDVDPNKLVSLLTSFDHDECIDIADIINKQNIECQLYEVYFYSGSRSIFGSVLTSGEYRIDPADTRYEGLSCLFASEEDEMKFNLQYVNRPKYDF